MISKKEVANQYNSLAEDYEERYQSEIRARIRNDIIFFTLKEIIAGRKCTILDAAGGTGFYSIPLVAKGQEVIILDLSKGMLLKARDKLRAEKIETVLGDAENIGFSNGAFDVVLCHLALCHFPEPIKALKEFQRVLRKDGVLSLIVENKAFFSIIEAFRGNIDEALKRLNSKELFVNIGELPRIRTFEKRELINMCSGAGLKAIKTMGLGVLTDYLQACRKETLEENKELKRLEKKLAETEDWTAIGRFLFSICKRSDENPR